MIANLRLLVTFFLTLGAQPGQDVPLPDAAGVAAAAVKQVQAEEAEWRERVRKLEQEIEGLAKARREVAISLDSLNKEIREAEGAISSLRVARDDARAGLRRSDKILEEIETLARERSSRLADWIARSVPYDSTRDALRARAILPSGEQAGERLEGLLDLAVELLSMGRATELYEAEVRNRAGYWQKATVLRAGLVGGAYTTADGAEVGILFPGGERASIGPGFFPAERASDGAAVRELFEAIAAGRTGLAALPIDVSRTLTVEGWTADPNLLATLTKGGPVMVPLLLVGLLGFGLVLERAFFLCRRPASAERILSGIEPLIRKGDYERAAEICRSRKGDAARVCLSGIESISEGREAVRDALHQGILSRIPRLERFLATIAVLATVAPMLGLLGTVSGMIRMFGVITGRGVGDAKILSGGISEALLTTQIGLAIAVPVLFLHSLLSSRVNRLVADMDQASIGLSKLLFGNHREAGKEAG